MKLRERAVPSHSPRALISEEGPSEGRGDRLEKARALTPRAETEGEHQMETPSFSSSSNTSHSTEAFPNTGCGTSSPPFRPTTSISGSPPSSASSSLPAFEFSSPLVTPVPPSIPPLLSLPGFSGPAGFAASLLPPPHSQAIPLSSSVHLSSCGSSSASSSEKNNECSHSSSPRPSLLPATEVQKCPSQSPTRTNSSFASVPDDPAVNTLQQLLTSSSSCSSVDQAVPPLASLPPNAPSQAGQAAEAVSSSSGQDGTSEENREVSSFRKRSDPTLFQNPSSSAHQQSLTEDGSSHLLDQPTASYQLHPYLISSSSSLVVSSSASPASSSVSYSEHHHLAQVVCLSAKEKRELQSEKDIRGSPSLKTSLLAASSPNLFPSTPSISPLLSESEEEHRQDMQQIEAPSPSTHNEGVLGASRTGTSEDTQTPLVKVLSATGGDGGAANVTRIYQEEGLSSYSSSLENDVSALSYELASSASSSFCLGRITTANGRTSFLSPRGFEEHQKKLPHQRPIDMDVTSISSMPSEMHARGTTGDEEREKTRSHSLSHHQEERTIEEGGEGTEKKVSPRDEHAEAFTSTTSLHPPVPSVPVGRILSREEVPLISADRYYVEETEVDTTSLQHASLFPPSESHASTTFSRTVSQQQQISPSGPEDIPLVATNIDSLDAFVQAVEQKQKEEEEQRKMRRLVTTGGDADGGEEFLSDELLACPCCKRNFVKWRHARHLQACTRAEVGRQALQRRLRFRQQQKERDKNEAANYSSSRLPSSSGHPLPVSEMKKSNKKTVRANAQSSSANLPNATPRNTTAVNSRGGGGGGNGGNKTSHGVSKDGSSSSPRHVPPVKGVSLQYPEKRSQRSFLQRHFPERAGAGGETAGGPAGRGRSYVVVNKEQSVSLKNADNSEMNPHDENSDDNDAGDKVTVILSKKDGGGRAQRRGMVGGLSKTGIPRARGCMGMNTITKTPRLTSTTVGEGQRDEFTAGNRNEKEMNPTSKPGSSSRLIVLSTHNNNNNNNRCIDADDWEMTRIPSLSEAREMRSGGRRLEDGESTVVRGRKEGELMRGASGGTREREATCVCTNHRHPKSSSRTKDGDGWSQGITEGLSSHIENGQTTGKIERKKNEEGEGSRSLSSFPSQTDKMQKMRNHFFSNTEMEATTSDAQEDRHASRQEKIQRDESSVFLNADNNRRWADNYGESSSGRSGCSSDGVETGTPSLDSYDTRVYDERRRQSMRETHETEAPFTNLAEEGHNSNNRQEDRTTKPAQDADRSALSSTHRGHPSSYSSYPQRGHVPMQSFLNVFLDYGGEGGKRKDLDDDDDQEVDRFETPRASCASTEDFHSESAATDTPSIQRQCSSQHFESSMSPAECNSSPYFGDRRRSPADSSSSCFSSPSPSSSLQDDSCECKRYDGYENTSDLSLTIRAKVFLASFNREDSSSSLSAQPCLYPPSAPPSVVDLPLPGSLSFKHHEGQTKTREREREEDQGRQKHSLPDGQRNKTKGLSSSSVLSQSLVIDQKNDPSIGRHSDSFSESLESGMSFEHHDRDSEGSPITVAAEHNKPKGERERLNRQRFSSRVRNMREGREGKYHTRTFRRPTECHTDGEGGSGENDNEIEEQDRETKGIRRRRMSCPGEHPLQREGFRSQEESLRFQSREIEEKKQVKDVFVFGRGLERKVEEQNVENPHHLRYGKDRKADQVEEEEGQERSMFILGVEQEQQPPQTDSHEEVESSREKASAFRVNVSERSRSGYHNDENDDVKSSMKRQKVVERNDFSSNSAHHRDDKAALSGKTYNTVNANRTLGEKEEVGGIVGVEEEYISSFKANHLMTPDHSHSHSCHHHHLSHKKNTILRNKSGHSPLTRTTPMVTTSSPPIDDILGKETSSSSVEEGSQRSCHSSQPPSPRTHHSYFPNHVPTSNDENTRKIDTRVDGGGSLKRSSQCHLSSPECPQHLSPSALSPSSSCSSPLYSDSTSHSNELPVLSPQEESDDVSMQRGTANHRNRHGGGAVYEAEKERKNKKKEEETYEENDSCSRKEETVKRDERHHIQRDHSKNSKNTKEVNDEDGNHEVRKQSNDKVKEDNEMAEEEKEKKNVEMTKKKRRETLYLNLDRVQRVCGEASEKSKEPSQRNPSHTPSQSKEENQKLSMKKVTASKRKTDDKETSLSVSCPDGNLERGVPDGKDHDEEDTTSHQVSSSLLQGDRSNQHQHPQGTTPNGNMNPSSSTPQTGGTGDREEAAAAPSSHRRHLFKGVRPENRWKLQPSKACPFCQRSFCTKSYENHVKVCESLRSARSALHAKKKQQRGNHVKSNASGNALHPGGGSENKVLYKNHAYDGIQSIVKTFAKGGGMPVQHHSRSTVTKGLGTGGGGGVYTPNIKGSHNGTRLTPRPPSHVHVQGEEEISTKSPVHQQTSSSEEIPISSVRDKSYTGGDSRKGRVSPKAMIGNNDDLSHLLLSLKEKKKGSHRSSSVPPRVGLSAPDYYDGYYGATDGRTDENEALSGGKEENARLIERLRLIGQIARQHTKLWGSPICQEKKEQERHRSHQQGERKEDSSPSVSVMTSLLATQQGCSTPNVEREVATKTMEGGHSDDHDNASPLLFAASTWQALLQLKNPPLGALVGVLLNLVVHQEEGEGFSSEARSEERGAGTRGRSCLRRGDREKSPSRRGSHNSRNLGVRSGHSVHRRSSRASREESRDDSARRGNRSVPPSSRKSPGTIQELSAILKAGGDCHHMKYLADQLKGQPHGQLFRAIARYLQTCSGSIGPGNERHDDGLSSAGPYKDIEDDASGLSEETERSTDSVTKVREERGNDRTGRVPRSHKRSKQHPSALSHGRPGSPDAPVVSSSPTGSSTALRGRSGRTRGEQGPSQEKHFHAKSQATNASIDDTSTVPTALSTQQHLSENLSSKQLPQKHMSVQQSHSSQGLQEDRRSKFAKASTGEMSRPLKLGPHLAHPVAGQHLPETMLKEQNEKKQLKKSSGVKALPQPSTPQRNAMRRISRLRRTSAPALPSEASSDESRCPKGVSSGDAADSLSSNPNVSTKGASPSDNTKATSGTMGVAVPENIPNSAFSHEGAIEARPTLSTAHKEESSGLSAEVGGRRERPPGSRGDSLVKSHHEARSRRPRCSSPLRSGPFQGGSTDDVNTRQHSIAFPPKHQEPGKGATPKVTPRRWDGVLGQRMRTGENYLSGTLRRQDVVPLSGTLTRDMRMQNVSVPSTNASIDGEQYVHPACLEAPWGIDHRLSEPKSGNYFGYQGVRPVRDTPRLLDQKEKDTSRMHTCLPVTGRTLQESYQSTLSQSAFHQSRLLPPGTHPDPSMAPSSLRRRTRAFFDPQGMSPLPTGRGQREMDHFSFSSATGMRLLSPPGLLAGLQQNSSRHWSSSDTQDRPASPPVLNPAARSRSLEYPRYPSGQRRLPIVQAIKEVEKPFTGPRGTEVRYNVDSLPLSRRASSLPPSTRSPRFGSRAFGDRDTQVPTALGFRGGRTCEEATMLCRGTPRETDHHGSGVYLDSRSRVRVSSQAFETSENTNCLTRLPPQLLPGVALPGAKPPVNSRIPADCSVPPSSAGEKISRAHDGHAGALLREVSDAPSSLVSISSLLQLDGLPQATGSQRSGWFDALHVPKRRSVSCIDGEHLEKDTREWRSGCPADSVSVHPNVDSRFEDPSGVKETLQKGGLNESRKGRDEPIRGARMVSTRPQEPLRHRAYSLVLSGQQEKVVDTPPSFSPRISLSSQTASCVARVSPSQRLSSSFGSTGAQLPSSSAVGECVSGHRETLIPQAKDPPRLVAGRESDHRSRTVPQGMPTSTEGTSSWARTHEGRSLSPDVDQPTSVTNAAHETQTSHRCRTWFPVERRSMFPSGRKPTETTNSEGARNDGSSTVWGDPAESCMSSTGVPTFSNGRLGRADMPSPVYSCTSSNGSLGGSTSGQPNGGGKPLQLVKGGMEQLDLDYRRSLNQRDVAGPVASFKPSLNHQTVAPGERALPGPLSPSMLQFRERKEEPPRLAPFHYTWHPPRDGIQESRAGDVLPKVSLVPNQQSGGVPSLVGGSVPGVQQLQFNKRTGTWKVMSPAWLGTRDVSIAAQGPMFYEGRQSHAGSLCSVQPTGFVDRVAQSYACPHLSQSPEFERVPPAHSSTRIETSNDYKPPFLVTNNSPFLQMNSPSQQSVCRRTPASDPPQIAQSSSSTGTYPAPSSSAREKGQEFSNSSAVRQLVLPGEASFPENPNETAAQGLPVGSAAHRLGGQLHTGIRASGVKNSGEAPTVSSKVGSGHVTQERKEDAGVPNEVWKGGYQAQALQHQLGQTFKLPRESQTAQPLLRGVTSGTRRCSPRAFTFGRRTPFHEQQPPPHQRELQQRLLGLKSSRSTNQTLFSSAGLLPAASPERQLIRSSSLDRMAGSGESRFAQTAAASGAWLAEGYPVSPATCTSAAMKERNFQSWGASEGLSRVQAQGEIAQDKQAQRSRSSLSLISVPLEKWQPTAKSEWTIAGQGFCGANRGHGIGRAERPENAEGTWASEGTAGLGAQTN
ncbi:c2hc-type zinc-finger protein [Cystoisospora suis]|uniref:C2hc-type zinc-finger protein n=1 Tax=Cystoisospora suis TaxID=483139 RepID=A0A2C6KWM1_9APIC|nr:c2hc-type zinc-finger protein [Cystoisospora suis]